MSDIIDSIVEQLETAYAEKDWGLVLDAVRLLNEIPGGCPPIVEDDGEYDQFPHDRF